MEATLRYPAPPFNVSLPHRQAVGLMGDNPKHAIFANSWPLLFCWRGTAATPYGRCTNAVKWKIAVYILIIPHSVQFNIRYHAHALRWGTKDVFVFLLCMPGPQRWSFILLVLPDIAIGPHVCSKPYVSLTCWLIPTMQWLYLQRVPHSTRCWSNKNYGLSLLIVLYKALPRELQAFLPIAVTCQRVFCTQLVRCFYRASIHDRWFAFEYHNSR